MAQSDSGNVATAKIWQFNETGNLTLPGNTFAVNYANGNPVVITGGGLPLANGTSNINIATANGNVTITANGSPTWTFATDGNLSLPTAGNIVGAVNIIGNGAGNLDIISNGRSWSFKSDGNLVLPLAGNIVNNGNVWNFGLNGILTLPGNSRVSPVGANIELQAAAGGYAEIVTSDGNSRVSVTNGGAEIVTSGINTWSFDNVGNLVLPGNTFAVKYANGTQVPIGGGSTGNVTFSDQAVIGTGDQVGGSGLYLAPGIESVGNSQYLRVRGGDFPTHIHLDTGNNVYFDQYFGDDIKYVKLANTGNIVISSDDAVGNTAQWTFATDGNLSLPAAGNIVGAVNIIGNGAGNVNVNANGRVWSYKSDGNLVLPLAGNIVNNGYVWTFDLNGVLTVPGEGVIKSIDDTVTLQSFNTSTGNANSVYLGTSGGLGFSDQSIGANWLEIFRSGTEPQIQTTVGNLLIQTTSNSTPYNWNFGSTGNLTVPGNINGSGASPAPSINGFNTINSVTVSASGNITGGNILTGIGVISTGGNVDGNVFNGNVAFGAGVVGGSGNITGGNLSVTGNITGNTAGFTVGYLNVPQVSFSGNATIAATDAGKHYYSTLSTANVLTIANNTSVSWAVGTAISLVNRGTGNITVAQGSGVSLYLAGNATAGNRTVTTYGMATLLNVAANIWMINGTGVS
jgi:hypothetical protein